MLTELKEVVYVSQCNGDDVSAALAKPLTNLIIVWNDENEGYCYQKIMLIL